MSSKAITRSSSDGQYPFQGILYPQSALETSIAPTPLNQYKANITKAPYSS